MTQTLSGNYDNKVDDYKTGLSRTQKHCLRFIHAFDLDPDEQKVTKTELANQKGLSSTKIVNAVDDLVEKGFVQLNDDNKLSITEEATKHL